MVAEERPHSKQRLSKYPLVVGSQQAEGVDQKPCYPACSATSTSSSGIVGPVATVMTITIEGSLHGPPPFDSAAFKLKLASKLDMESEQFKVKKVQRGGRSLHDVQTSPGVSITVDMTGSELSHA